MAIPPRAWPAPPPPDPSGARRGDAEPALELPPPEPLTLPPAMPPQPGLASPPAQAPRAASLQRDRGLVSLIVPAKNEEAGIGATLRSLPLATLQAQGFRTEVIVLDGNSADRTRAIARAWGAQVVRQTQPGKGAAFREARHLVKGAYVVMLDADSTYPADAIPGIVEALAQGEADVVMGSRRRGWVAPGAMGPVNRFGNLLLSAIASVLYLRRCSDVCTGMWGFRGGVFRTLPLASRGFELEVELFGRTARAGHALVEVPVDYLPRRGGTKLSRTRDGLRIGWWLVRTRFAAPPANGVAPRPAPEAVAEERA